MIDRSTASPYGPAGYRACENHSVQNVSVSRKDLGRVDVRHRRLVAGRPRQDERNPVALAHGEVGGRLPGRAAQRDGGRQPDQVGPGDGVDLAARAPDPRHFPAVVEPRPQHRPHRHLAVQAHRDPDHVRRARPGRHEVDDPHRALRADPVRLEHQGAPGVPAPGAPAARRRGQRPPSRRIAAEERGERGGRVEPRQAQPVNRPGGAHQRGRVQVAEQGVILDLRHFGHSRSARRCDRRPAARSRRWSRSGSPRRPRA